MDSAHSQPEIRVRLVLQVGQVAAGVLVLVGLIGFRPMVMLGLLVALGTPLAALGAVALTGHQTPRLRVFAVLTAATLLLGVLLAG